MILLAVMGVPLTRLALLFLAVLGLTLAQPAMSQNAPKPKLDRAALQEAKQVESQGDEALKQGHLTEAAQLFERALKMREDAAGPDHPSVGQSLTDLGRTYRALGRYSEAEPLLTRALALREKLGPDKPPVAVTLNQLAQLYTTQGRYADAEPLRQRALAIQEKEFGAEDVHVVGTLTSLASLYRLEGRYAEAEPLVRRALAIGEKFRGADSPGDVTTLESLARLDMAIGHFAEAGPLLEHAMSILERERGPEHPSIPNVLDAQAELTARQGRYVEAEAIYRRSLALREKIYGADHPSIAQSLDLLASLYRSEGLFHDAELLAKRALAIREKALGPNHPAVAGSLNVLAFLYINQNRLDAAEPLLQRALAIREKTLGPDHRAVANVLSDLASINLKRGAPPEKIEPLLKRALAIQEKSLSPDNPDIAKTVNMLAASERRHGQYEAAEPLAKRALAIREKSFGPDHPVVAESYNSLANIYWAEGRPELALEQNKHATEILIRHLDSEATQRLGGDTFEEHHFRGAFVLSVALDYDTAVAVPKRHDELVEDSFRMAQLAQSSSAASALAGMAARFAAGSDALAKVVRDRQDLLDQWRKLNDAMIQAMGRPADQRKGDAEGALRKDIDAVTQQLADLDRRIGKDFPAYAELSNSQPLSVAATQALLAEDEALLVYIVAAKASWLWVVRRNKIEFSALDITARDLLIAVRSLRVTLDPGLNQNFHAYPASDAYALYQRILAPATPLLVGVHHVLIVPDGALQSLPVGVLVTKPPAHDPQKLEEHRDLAWFARDYAVTVLPAVSTLRALRQFAIASKAAAPFIGIGDPVLKGGAGETRGAANFATLLHGNMADVDKLRALPPLPETAEELRTVAEMLGAPASALLLGARASEPSLAKAELNHYRVIEFATHGLVSGEISGLAEPALVLTPPDKASAENDGLLTASKIAKLKLDADWVVLSACNTAAGDGTPGADGLSGLAKAFFYAGSRAMLVSNWPIASKAAVKLTTGIFDALKKDPSIGRAEALRRSEMAMLDDPNLPAAFAHPMIWAPFTLAGEGGAKR